MQVLADQRDINKHVVSAVSYPDKLNVYVAFKLNDDRISLMHFQGGCLINMYSFVVQV
jgi:hypothetical protein